MFTRAAGILFRFLQLHEDLGSDFGCQAKHVIVVDQK